MKYAILSDIHSNLQALEKVLEICDSIKVDSIVCLGDVVGYNANPLECIKLVQERCSHCVKGNHDELGSRELTFGDSMHWSKDAIEGIKHTYSQINSEDRQWLSQLEFFDIVEDKNLPFTIGHGIPFEIKYLPIYEYIFQSTAKCVMEEFISNFKKTKIGFFGHTHCQTVIYGYPDDSNGNFTHVDMGGKMLKGELGLREIGLSKVASGDQFILINPGSVGQPRGESPNSFVILETKENKLSFELFDYDREAAKRAITDANYWNRLAKRLDPVIYIDEMF